MTNKQLFKKHMGKRLYASGEDPAPYPRPYRHGHVTITDMWDVGNGYDFGFKIAPVGREKGYIYPGVDDVQPIFGGIKVIYSNAFGHKGFLNLTEIDMDTTGGDAT